MSLPHPPLTGIHHVTALAGDPRRNLATYAATLGLRLVKRTVNFDDPATHHLYYGNQLGSPGSILTFFPWPGARRGRPGPGQATATAFAVPAGSLAYWSQRLAATGLAVDSIEDRFAGAEEVLPFLDSDGLRLELVAHHEADARQPWADGPVPAEHAIRGFHAVTLTVNDPAPTLELLTAHMGLRVLGTEGVRTRLDLGAGGSGAHLDLIAAPQAKRGLVAAGTVHHVAWRVRDDEHQLIWREHLLAQGYQLTPQVDRQYFRSVYFREPGGVLFELATDPPGFGIDEPIERLGSTLRLPPWLEPHRARIEAALPPLGLPMTSEIPA